MTEAPLVMSKRWYRYARIASTALAAMLASGSVAAAGEGFTPQYSNRRECPLLKVERRQPSRGFAVAGVYWLRTEAEDQSDEPPACATARSLVRAYLRQDAAAPGWQQWPAARGSWTSGINLINYAVAGHTVTVSCWRNVNPKRWVQPTR